MRISYRTRQFYRRLFRLILAVILAALVVLLCWVLWLRRFIIYTEDGAKIDFSLSQQWPQGQTGPEIRPVVQPDIYYTDPETPDIPDAPKVRFEGCFVTVDDLLEDLDAVRAKLLSLPEGTPVMLDVKGYRGRFYYSTATGAPTSPSFDMAVMDAFFDAVNQAGLYTIARLPAFRDYQFAAEHNSAGLATVGGYLWVDDNRIYWLDPANDMVLTNLIDITKELRDMGFDEVAFQDFRFPDTNEIVYDGDRAQALEKAAKTLVTACATESFAVSFITSAQTPMVLPEGNCRLYVTDVAAYDVPEVIARLEPATAARAVFFTSSYDTRFDNYGVIRPYKMMQ